MIRKAQLFYFRTAEIFQVGHVTIGYVAQYSAFRFSFRKQSGIAQSSQDVGCYSIDVVLRINTVIPVNAVKVVKYPPMPPIRFQR